MAPVGSDASWKEAARCTCELTKKVGHTLPEGVFEGVGELEGVAVREAVGLQLSKFDGDGDGVLLAVLEGVGM